MLRKQRQSMNYTFIVDGDRHTTNKKDEMTNEFNMFFLIKVGPNLEKDITNQNEHISTLDYLGGSTEQSLFLK